MSTFTRGSDTSIWLAYGLYVAIQMSFQYVHPPRSGFGPSSDDAADADADDDGGGDDDDGDDMMMMKMKMKMRR